MLGSRVPLTAQVVRTVKKNDFTVCKTTHIHSKTNKEQRKTNNKLPQKECSRLNGDVLIVSMQAYQVDFAWGEHTWTVSTFHSLLSYSPHLNFFIISVGLKNNIYSEDSNNLTSWMATYLPFYVLSTASHQRP